MTPTDAEELKPHDRVTIRYSPSSRGEVTGVRPLSVFIQWLGGNTVQYQKHSMDHIERDQEQPHEKT